MSNRKAHRRDRSFRRFEKRRRRCRCIWCLGHRVSGSGRRIVRVAMAAAKIAFSNLKIAIELDKEHSDG